MNRSAERTEHTGKTEHTGSTEQSMDLPSVTETSQAIMHSLGNQLEKADTRIFDLTPDQIVPDPDQPRRSYDEDSLLDLAQSIQASGVLQPIVVKPDQSASRSGQNINMYRLVMGERRWRALQLTDRQTIPAIVRHENDSRILAMQIIENNQREDIAPMDEARALQRLVEISGNKKSVADIIGRSPSWLSKRLSLLNAPEAVIDLAENYHVQDINTLNSLSHLLKEDAQTAAQLIEAARNGQLPGGLRSRVEQARKQAENGNRSNQSAASPDQPSHDKASGNPMLDNQGMSQGSAPSESASPSGRVSPTERDNYSLSPTDSSRSFRFLQQLRQTPIHQLQGIERSHLSISELEREFAEYLQKNWPLPVNTDFQQLWQRFMRTVMVK